MHRSNVVLWDPAEVSRGMDSKQLVADLHDSGLARDEAVEMLCLVFGIPRGAARLFVASHPAWAAETAKPRKATSLSARPWFQFKARRVDRPNSAHAPLHRDGSCDAIRSSSLRSPSR
jgi:hypothetical protein